MECASGNDQFPQYKQAIARIAVVTTSAFRDFVISLFLGFGPPSDDYQLLPPANEIALQIADQKAAKKSIRSVTSPLSEINPGSTPIRYRRTTLRSYDPLRPLKGLTGGSVSFVKEHCR